MKVGKSNHKAEKEILSQKKKKKPIGYKTA